MTNRFRNNVFNWLTILTGLLLVSLTGCQSVGPGAATGGAFGTFAGGLTGAAIGASEGKAPEGALIGALAGGTVGSIAGNAVDRSVERDRLNHELALNQQRQSAVNFDQIIRMTQSGLGSNVIASQIHSQGIVRRPNIDELILMKNQGVDDLVIQAVQNAPVAGATPIVGRSRPVVRHEIIHHEPYCYDRYIPVPYHGFHYRHGCRPRAGFSVKF